MMQFKIDQSSIDTLLKEVNLKLDGVRVISSTRSKEAIAKASFTILSKEFIRRTGILAAANPKAYHHIYEWGHVGDSRHKLFKLRRGDFSNGSLSIIADFVDSKTPVPIDQALTFAGKNGKSVKNKHVFKKKAQIMEAGQPTRPFAARRAGALVFMSEGRMVFVRRPDTVVIKHPGGRSVKGSFSRQFNRWFNNPNNISKTLSASGLFRDLEISVAKSLSRRGAGAEASMKSVQEVTTKYAEGARIL